VLIAFRHGFVLVGAIRVLRRLARVDDLWHERVSCVQQVLLPVFASSFAPPCSLLQPPAQFVPHLVRA